MVRTPTMTMAINRKRIERIERAQKSEEEKKEADSEDKTNFEKAEELYHQGKLTESLPLYEKSLRENPQNLDAAQRIQEIQNRVVNKFKTQGLTIKPVSEQDVILQAARNQPSGSTGQQGPFSGTQPPSSSGASPFQAPAQTEPGQQSSQASPFAIESRSSQETAPQQPVSPFGQQQPPSQKPSQTQTSPFDTGGIPQSQKSTTSSPFQDTPQMQQPAQRRSSRQGLPPMSQTQKPDTSQGSPFAVTPQEQQSGQGTVSPFAVSPGTMEAAPSQQVQSPFQSQQIGQTMEPQPPVSQPPPPPSSPFETQPSSPASPFDSKPAESIAPFEEEPTPGIPPMRGDQADESSPFISPSEIKPVSPVTTPEKSTIPVKSTISESPSSMPRTPADGEFRGMWLTRFEWPDQDPAKCRQNILNYLDDISEAGYNAVFFQVRGQGDALYPSPYEPWSPLVGSRNPGFDPLLFALDEAHARDLEFHAYVNVYPVWQGETPPPHTKPEHPYWLYCQPDSDPMLACVDSSGKVMVPDAEKNDNYVYFSPGHPGVDEYLRKIVMDIVQRYPVDGIHFDRIRYPGMSYSFDPVSEQRFKGAGNPHNLSHDDWQREQITRFLNRVYGEVASVKPEIKISCAVWGIYNNTRYPGYDRFSSGYHQYYQDTFAWLERGVIDAACPMIYWDMNDPAPNYDVLAKDFVENASGRHIYLGNYINKQQMTREEYQNQISYGRQIGAEGYTGFSAGGFRRKNLSSWFKNNIFTSEVEPAVMSWKQNPTTGIIIGKVIRGDTGEPVTDAQIRISGREYVYLSGADGFFSILNLSPGSGYQLAASSQDFGQAMVDAGDLESGEVKNVTVRLGE